MAQQQIASQQAARPSRSGPQALVFCLFAASAWLLCLGGSFAFLPGRPGPLSSAGDSQEASLSPQRRQLLAGLGLSAAVPAAPALAYEVFKDTNLGVEFRYPTGLQKTENKLYNTFLKDVIEPLEAIGIKVVDSGRGTLEDIGDAKAVAEKLVADSVPEKAPREILSATSKIDDKGRRLDIIEYVYQWKFSPELRAATGRTRFELRNKAIITVYKRKQYLVVASCESQNWELRGDGQLALAIDTFKLLF